MKDGTVSMRSQLVFGNRTVLVLITVNEKIVFEEIIVENFKHHIVDVNFNKIIGTFIVFRENF